LCFLAILVETSRRHAALALISKKYQAPQFVESEDRMRRPMEIISSPRRDRNSTILVSGQSL